LKKPNGGVLATLRLSTYQIPYASNLR